MSDFSARHKFAAWPNRGVPEVSAGVYAVWEEERLIYCGMSGREYEQALASNRRKYGMVTRLASHASGRLSGDQFCVYVANRLVIPTLAPAQLTKFATGSLTLDKLTKTYIREKFEYQVAYTDGSAQAYELERRCRNGSVFGLKPLLNPL